MTSTIILQMTTTLLRKCYGNATEILQLCYGCATALQPTVTTVNYTDYRFRGNVTWFADGHIKGKKYYILFEFNTLKCRT